MGREEEEQEGGTTFLKLPLLPSKPHSHKHSLSSPIHPMALASVSFSWEEEPGKPKHQPSSSSSPSSSSCSPNKKSLELPPRLLDSVEKDGKSIAKLLSSPSTVLDGPYSMGRSRRFESSSFRMMVVSGGDCYGSFGSDIYGGLHETEEEEMKKKSLVLARKREGYRGRRLGFVGFWRKRALKGNTELGGGSYIFPTSVHTESEEDGNGRGDEEKVKMISRTGSFSTLSSSTPKSHFWTTVCEGLKQVVVPWKNKKIRI
ncbi:PREDICTED: uncharacterized protein At4g00950-like [Tarenaya hassleriana]|uniref:uncharacterized protein At4g00950-like n=1 Tax=Tarenaya hassleriana TaxID=28532 RepID=UPI00053C6F9C|nr:PREDICTED: uncharacterized protein At4g00950-like [Tarenaya hassleriana]